MTAISVDRLLALLLGLRYKQIVTLKRTYIIVTTFWVFTLVTSSCGIFYHRIIFFSGCPVTLLCLVISVASYTKIFCTLRYHQAQVRDQQQPSQANALNMARFRKAVYSAWWVQLALVICYTPIFTVEIVIAHTKKYSLLLLVTWRVTHNLLSFNSTLNPFLYCWKISEVRQAVKQTIRQVLCWVRSSSSSSDFQSRLIKSVTLLYFNSTLNPFLYCWKISEVKQAVKQTIREALCWVRSLRVVLRTFKADSLSHDYFRAQLLNKLLDKKNKRLNRIVAQAVFDGLHISENNLTTD